MFLRRILATTLSISRRCFNSNNSNQDVTSTISELNKELESVFGKAPSNDNPSSVSNHYISKEKKPEFISPGIRSENGQHLTHVSSTGKAQMVDVSSKETSKRVAVAGCKVILGKKVFDLVSDNQIAKGDVLTVAKVAGICGAKQTSNLIPLCHNISLTHVLVNLTLNREDFSVDIEGEAASTGKTGVEMEAMTAVTIAGLTVYDMCKAASKDIRITNIQLECKFGGKSGDWSRKH